MANLALGDKSVQRAHTLGEGDRLAGPVDQIEVEVVEAEPDEVEPVREAKRSDEDYAKFVEQTVEPRFREMVKQVRASKTLEPRVVYGWWPCYADRNSLDLIRVRYPEIPAKAAACVLIEVEGDDLDAWHARLEKANALIDASWFADSARDRERFRAFRHTLPEMVNSTVLSRGFLKMGTDYATPFERTREMIAYYRERCEAEIPGHYVIYGHIGDGHPHVNMLPASEREAEICTKFLTEFARKAVELGGTVSAEHGLGKRKAHLLTIQYAPEHIEAMMAVKRRLDPEWLLGRGTLFPVPAGV